MLVNWFNEQFKITETVNVIISPYMCLYKNEEYDSNNRRDKEILEIYNYYYKVPVLMTWNYNTFLEVFKLYLCVSTSGRTYMSWRTWGGQRATSGSWFSPSTVDSGDWARIVRCTWQVHLTGPGLSFERWLELIWINNLNAYYESWGY